MDFDYSTETITPDNSGMLTFSGGVEVIGHWSPSVTVNLTATGTTQGTAAIITNTTTIVNTSGAGAGVLLPSSDTVIAGTQITVTNGSSYVVNIYPPVGSAINDQANNVPISLAAGETSILTSTALFGVAWITNCISLIAGSNISLSRTLGSVTISASRSQISVGTTPPSSPSVGDLWVDTN